MLFGLFLFLVFHCGYTLLSQFPHSRRRFLFQETLLKPSGNVPIALCCAIGHRCQAWAADITYLTMARGFLYLVAILDWHSRYVVVWRLPNSLEADFCVDALREALGQGRPEVFNTGQGSQFTILEFTQVLQEHGVKISMDGKGRYTDNIFVERLWRTVKYEEVYLKANASESRRELGACLRFCNGHRPHQALGYRTPAEVFHEGTNVGEEGAVKAKEFPTEQTLVSLAGTAGLSLNSTPILSNYRVHLTLRESHHRFLWAKTRFCLVVALRIF